MSTDIFKIYIPSTLLVILAFVLAYQFVEPAPPSKIAMATGAGDGAYALTGLEYKRALAKVGIELELIHTSGSVENIKLLQSGEADLAFVQGGVKPPETDEAEIQALGSVFLEPLWVFSGDPDIDRLTGLRGKRIAIGPKGSGTRQLSRMLLNDNGLSSESSEFLELSSSDAKRALMDGTIDAAFFVVSERSPMIADLMLQSDLHLMSFERSGAYAQRYRFMQETTLFAGAIDLAVNIPKRTTQLLAASAVLVIDSNLHPALVDLMMQVARSVHRSGGLLEAPDAYPSPLGHGLELNEHARKFYDRGPPFLLRYLPFWAANLVDRMAVMLIPLLTLILPLARILPPALDWRVRSKVYCWYDDLREVEVSAEKKLTPERMQALQAKLDKLEEQVSGISVPLTRTDLVYTLRVHIALIRERLRARG